MQSSDHTRIDTRTVSLPSSLSLALALLGALWFAAPARAADTTPPETSAAPAATATDTASSKQWVWLWRQGLYGFGHRREDGLWVIDAGTKTGSPAAAESAPAKQWVWLWRQGLYGFGHQREDGLWVIDAGTKRAASPVAVAPVAAAAPTFVPTSYTVATAAPAPAAAGGDPYGFVNWLNATRASFGLPAVSVDPGLSQEAAANNAQQAARGMGHHVMGSARRQNAAAGGNSSTVGPMWMASPAHRAALLDPTIRSIGIAGLGAYWTFNAR